MSEYEDMDEEMRRILDEGSASAAPRELADLRAQLAQEPDMSGDFPAGTKVVIEPEVSAPPTRRVVTGAPAVPAEKVVQVPGSPAAVDDLELAAAKVENRKARQREAFERGTRQLIGGLTRTEALPSQPVTVDAVKDLYARRKMKDDTHAKAEAGRLGAAKLNYDTKEAARKAALDQTRDARDFEYRQKHDAESLAQQAKNAEATRALAGAGLGLRREEVDMKKTEKAERQSAGAFPLADGTFTAKPGLSESMTSQAMAKGSKWNTAIGNLDKLDGALSAYVASPGRESKANVESLLQGAMTSLNVAYEQGAMAETEARRLSEALGADITSPTGIEAAVRSWMGQDPAQAGKLLMSRLRAVKQAARDAAINSLSTYGTFAEGAAQSPQGTQDDGKVTISNGKETLRIPAARLKDAERDGFKRVQ